MSATLVTTVVYPYHLLLPLLFHIPASLTSLSLQNIAKAQKEIDRLEEEAAKETSASASSPPSSSSRRTHDSAKKSAAAHAHQAVNGTVVAATSAPDAEAELAQEKDAVADVTEDVRQASLEDGKD